MHHLVFVPELDLERFLLWGEGERGWVVPWLQEVGAPGKIEVVTAEGQIEEVDGTVIALLPALASLVSLQEEEALAVSPSLFCWTRAARLALEWVGQERILPRVKAGPSGWEARWEVLLEDAEDKEQFRVLAAAFPPAAHAIPVEGAPEGGVWAPEALLRAFFNAVADTLVREVAREKKLSPQERLSQQSARAAGSWAVRWLAALSSGDPSLALEGVHERRLPAQLAAWAQGPQEQSVGGGGVRLGLALALPNVQRGRPESSTFLLHFFLEATEGEGRRLPAEQIWSVAGRSLSIGDMVVEAPQERLLQWIAGAGRIFTPLQRALAQPRPVSVELSAYEASYLLDQGAASLEALGVSVVVPDALQRGGAGRLTAQWELGNSSGSQFGLAALVEARWQLAVGGEVLKAAEAEQLLAEGPGVRWWRGRWVSVGERELGEARARLERGKEKLSARAALSAVFGGEDSAASPLAQSVIGVGGFGQLLERLRQPTLGRPLPPSFRGELRPYQERGVAWLSTLASVGLGSCLADDMGLGKTVQLIAMMALKREANPTDPSPFLVVCPTSVLGNWEREIHRFCPSLRVVRHYGGERHRDPSQIRASAEHGVVVLTSYGLLRRDEAILSAVQWGLVVADEAQNIKNATSSAARALRALRAPARVAMTGTPVENRLMELWSIFAFLNPGLLGTQEAFRREFAIPIEKEGDREAAQRLKRLIGPFLLRRVKSDPSIVPDLPEKQEYKVVCTLSKEQATLYKQTVDNALSTIRATEGFHRRGLVLGLATALKQICNHPEHFEFKGKPLAGRSGKLDRLAEMLEEIREAGEKALVFTQFREMGDLMVPWLQERLGEEVLFLHGGTPIRQRDAMVQRFQADTARPGVFLLSLKAGGTGLNLTAASHVFHFDRWWNPAIEDQATDRAHRIGQTRSVQVHKLVAANTVEEKVAQLLEDKRRLANLVVGAGEQWLTELDDAALAELFGLGGDEDDAEEGEA